MVSDPNHANTGLQVKPTDEPVCYSSNVPLPLSLTRFVV